MDQQDHPHAAVLPEVATFVADLRARGQIAVDTPELRLFVQQRLLDGLREEVAEAVRDEFITAEEADELHELFASGEVNELDARLRYLLPQYAERFALVLERIGETLTNR